MNTGRVEELWPMLQFNTVDKKKKNLVLFYYLKLRISEHRLSLINDDYNGRIIEED